MPAYTASDDALQYDERGAGAPVVVLGGGPARHPDYLGDLGGLATGFRLVVPHLRGIGGSPFPADPRRASWWEQAADVEALRRHLGLERVTVLGHSAGALIALAFAARFPGSLERLVLVTPPAAALVDVPADVPAIRARRAGEPVYEAALTIAQGGPPSDGDDRRFTVWQQTIAPLSYARWDAPQQQHCVIGDWSTAAVSAYAFVDPPADLPSKLQAVQAPVVVIVAAEDGVVGVDAPVALAGLFPTGRSLRIEGAGHYPWVDQPERFVSKAQEALGG